MGDRMVKQNDELTWEDVTAVCKVLGVDYEFYEDLLDVRRPGALCGTCFTQPDQALEFISAPKHELEN